jgi:hypothetical protein
MVFIPQVMELQDAVVTYDRSADILKSFCTQEIFFDVHGYVV